MNFFGKYFKYSFLILIGIEIFSFLAHQHHCFSLIFFILLSSGVFIISLYKLELGVFAALGELVIGSQGYLFSINIFNFHLSLRIAFFLLLTLSWIIHVIRAKKTDLFKTFANKWLILLGVFVIWGMIMAYISQNSPQNIYFDLNGWIYFCYLPIFLDFFSNKNLNNKCFSPLLQIFTASVTMVCLKTFFLLYYFSHVLPNFKILYFWVRDTRFGEITLLSGNFYRIFSQSHIWVLFALFVFLGFLIFKNKFKLSIKQNIYLGLIILLCLSTTIISLSRSNWVGLSAGIITLYLIAAFKQKLGWKKLLRVTGALLILIMLSISLIAGTMYFPFPKAGEINATDMLKERLQIDEAAVSSRWSQLPALSKALIKHLIIGSGWGTTITYISQDPRILESNPSGEYTTYAFEWGYLDIMLKIGLVGLFIYLLLLYNIWRQGWQLLKKNLTNREKALVIGFLLALASLIFTHGFSPYLNHPLGIGFLLLTISLFNYYRTKQNLTI